MSGDPGTQVRDFCLKKSSLKGRTMVELVPTNGRSFEKITGDVSTVTLRKHFSPHVLKSPECGTGKSELHRQDDSDMLYRARLQQDQIVKIRDFGPCERPQLLGSAILAREQHAVCRWRTTAVVLYDCVFKDGRWARSGPRTVV